jgi:hypothetical protein
MVDKIIVCMEGDVIKAGCSSDDLLTSDDSVVTLVEGEEKSIECNGKTVILRVSSQTVIYRVVSDEIPETSSQFTFLVSDDELQCKVSAF